MPLSPGGGYVFLSEDPCAIDDYDISPYYSNERSNVNEQLKSRGLHDQFSNVT